MSRVFGRCVRPASKSFKRTKYSTSADIKNVCSPLSSGYIPTEIEQDCQNLWESNNFFRKKSDEKFIMVLPPPNVTGSLHLGHALTCAVQDSIARWKQMSDYEVVWVPGCDHAGIATQVVVEKHLWATQSLTRHQLGREKFVAEVWKWRNEKGTIIYDQMRRLGVALDWDRAVFTMDEQMSDAVSAAFIELFEGGLVYRGKRLVNWCCALQSAISDIEIEHIEMSCPTELEVPGYNEKVTFGKIFDFAYKVCDTEEELVVSTTRPETMLGDTAVMVHPQDPRFQHLLGKHVQHPFRGDTIPIIADDAVDPGFGTGAVKVTPAHDSNDYEVGQRHKLPHLSILTDQGTITDIVPQFEGQPRFIARGTILKALTDLGLYRGSRAHSMTVPRCSRTNDIIEPRLRPQWFVNCKSMAKAAIAAVENGDLQIHPTNYTRDWHAWLHDTRDWCVSRQLWWGHRIPVYRVNSKHINVDEGDIWVAARSLEEAKSKGATKLGINENEVNVKQEEDVLDTWFSSGLFPFAVFGWPNDTIDLNRYYPTNLLETGHDILFFWVARMVMLGLHLTHKLPFKEVLLHGLVCDSGGHKMSKSRGNVIDPMDVITGASLQTLNESVTASKERGIISPDEASVAIEGQTVNFPQGIPTCGADALRFTLCSNNIKNKLLSVDVVRMEQNKFFGNKIWQTTRFLLSSILRTPNGQQQARILSMEDRNTLQAMDCWILSRLSELVEEANRNMNCYDLHFVTSAFTSFWNNYLCDVYLESIKPVVHHGSCEDRNAALLTLWTCVSVGLRVLHPFMPHLTEHLHQHMSQTAQGSSESTSIMTESYPQDEQWSIWRDVSLENKIEVSVLQSAASLRNLKATYNITSGKVKGSMICNDPSVYKFLQEMVHVVSTLGRVKSVNLMEGPADPPSATATATVNDTLTIHLHLKGAIDLTTENARLQKKLKNLQKDTDKLLRIVSAPGYAEKSPQHIQDNHHSKLSSLQKEHQQVKSLLSSIKDM
ncbi:unnamed protein product [Meganyctiphanes norvegica]|uniref:Valine--tRNA ligase n=1 Tax=Meganyctiphanes norvegica TaxID=48144 RepID=A0AAV2PPW5_MEGNR